MRRPRGFRDLRSAALGLGLALVVWLGATSASADEWQSATPAEAGFDPAVVSRLDAAVAAGELPGLHSVLVVRGGRLAIERYYAGEDQRRGGSSLGHVDFGPESLHDLRSVTKSVVGLLYGISLAAGEVPDLERSLIEAFPEIDGLDSDPRRARMTVRHALTMTLGTAWDESLPYSDPRNSETAMDGAEDPLRYVLERPMIEEPGQTWTYNGGTTALLAALIARGAGRPIEAVAQERLFAPLGIEAFEWAADRAGVAYAASGLRLRPRDLAKIGLLILREGLWEGPQVVPADWLAQALTPRIAADYGLDYGYQWWLGKRRNSEEPWYQASGNGGQRLMVVPSLDLAVVITAGNYNQPEAWRVPAAVVQDFLAPALDGPQKP